MRILFVSQLYPSSTEPLKASYNRQLIKALAVDHDVKVIAPVMYTPGLRVLRGQELPPEEEQVEGIDVWHPRIRYPAGMLRRQHWRFYRNHVAACLTRVVAEFAPDVAILGFIYPDAVGCADLCRNAMLPYVIRVNGSDFRVRVQQAGFKELVINALSTADAVICPGDILREDIIASGVNPQNVHRFMNGVDRERFHPSDKDSDGDSRILFVGNLVPGKRVDVLVEAFARVRDVHPKARLQIVGSGPEQSKVEMRSEQLEIDNFVEFHGSVDHNDVAILMRRATCLCLPSNSEGMPNVVVEALATGLPVLATNVGEIPNLVKHEENGWLCDVADDGLVSNLESGLNYVLGRQWSRKAIASSIDGLTWQNAAADVVTVLKAVLDSSNKSI